MNRQHSLIDNVLDKIQGLMTQSNMTSGSKRPYPGASEPETHLTHQEKKHIAGLMRVNHAGEVAAQALYQGQALTARHQAITQQMQQSAREEIDHLHWCQQRLAELDSKPSLLSPLWHIGSLAIGSIAGLAGDQWSLGFVEETENQVMAHLDNHLEKLPESDKRSEKILKQMHQDEAHHAHVARQAGAKELPAPIKRLMGLVSKVMTFTAYRI